METARPPLPAVPLPDWPLLAFDTSSPVVTVAAVQAGRQGEVLAFREEAQRQSSKILLRLVDEVLAEAGVKLGDLGGLVALQGPGSFTGLRVGLATVLGLHQATGLPATAVPTLLTLAAASSETAGTVIAAVDALRGSWYVQAFRLGGALGGALPEEIGEAAWLPAAQVEALAAEVEAGEVIGFGVEALSAGPDSPAGWPTRCRPREVAALGEPLAAVSARLAAAHPTLWDPRRLTRPLYLRPPAVTPAKVVAEHG